MSYRMLEAIAKFRAKLDAGRVCLGAGITLGDPLVTDALGDSVDFFWVDNEHCLMSAESLNGHLLAARAHGVPAIVRLPGSSVEAIKPVLDSGAEGIIVPQVRSAQEVRDVVGNCRYPPLGRRGYGPRIPSNYGRDGGAEYIARANRDLFVSVQVENAEAFGALDEIVSVPGLDSVVLGPWDLAASLGHPNEPEHPEVAAALKTIIEKARGAGLYVGSGMGADPDYACLMAKRGVQWLQLGGDYDYIISQVGQITAQVRSRLGATGSDVPAEQR